MTEQVKEQEQQPPQQQQQEELSFIPTAITIALGFKDEKKGFRSQDIRHGSKLGDTGLGYYGLFVGGELRYMPTHLPTGFALSPTAMTWQNCEAYLRELAATGIDWNSVDESGPAREKKAGLSQLREKYLTPLPTPADEETEEETEAEDGQDN
jgi:hypothetical protein